MLITGLCHRMQPSYAQDLGVNSIEHGVYGSFINALGGCLGLLGAIPCCPVSLTWNLLPQVSRTDDPLWSVP
jgi:hypothetical protein